MNQAAKAVNLFALSAVSNGAKALGAMLSSPVAPIAGSAFGAIALATKASGFAAAVGAGAGSPFDWVGKALGATSASGAEGCGVGATTTIAPPFEEPLGLVGGTITIAVAEALGRGLAVGVDVALADGLEVTVGVALDDAETEGEEVGLGLDEGVF